MPPTSTGMASVTRHSTIGASFRRSMAGPEKMPWVALSEGIPAFERDYRLRDLLPHERIERLKALARG